jgi:beta-1,4-mannosyl-glycoprotein beta-1,4-N-acetylglucosaminyltransferase
MFFNELDLLEIRLNELDTVVDKFVLVECTKTHSLQSKPLYFEENKERYTKFLHKIIHVIVSDMPAEIEYQHHIDNFHRGCIMRGLGDALPDDLILISDLDEIPEASLINLKMPTPTVFSHQCFGYALNIKVESPQDIANWLGTVVIRNKDFDHTPIQTYRESRREIALNSKIEGGWHYSYLGDAKTIFHKLKSFSHTEILEQFPSLSEDYIQNCINTTTDFLGFFRFPPHGAQHKKYSINEIHAPQYVLDNKEKFKHLIKS